MAASSSQDQDAAVSSGAAALDTTVANPARVWNYWLGGKDNFAADREAAGQAMQAMPAMPLIARMARQFLGDAVRHLAGNGIGQFLDIGTGPADRRQHPRGGPAGGTAIADRLCRQ